MRPISPSKVDPPNKPDPPPSTNLAECAAIAAMLLVLAGFLWGLTHPGFRAALGHTLSEVGRVMAGGD